MNLNPFKLEKYFAKYEFAVKYLLSSSDCDGQSQQKILGMADAECQHLWENLKLGYTESSGLPILRQEIAKLYPNLNSENILVMAPEEGIFVALNCMLEKGDHLICTYPCYQSLFEIASGIGCNVTKWELNEESGWNLDINFLEKNIRPNTKLLIINFPHNPTGYLPSNEKYLKILDFAMQHNLYVFSDEMYYLLEQNPAIRLSPACEIYENAISLFGMSKTFGMAGVRIGWLATKNTSLLEKISILKDYTTICSSAPSEILSLIALKNKDKIVKKNLDTIGRNLHLADAFFTDQKNRLSWVRPLAGTIGFVKIKLDIGAFEFCQNLVKHAQIMLLPSTVYGFGDKHFRFGFGRINFPEVLEKFNEYLKENY